VKLGADFWLSEKLKINPVTYLSAQKSVVWGPCCW